MSEAGYSALFDASALAKLFLDEDGSTTLRRYWNIQPTKYTTPFCLYETLGILKVCARRKAITRAVYLDCAARLTSWFHASTSRLEDIDFTNPEVFNDARDIAERSGLDLSDAFQLLTLQAGLFASMIGGSQSLLVTADGALTDAARRNNLRVWNCLREPMPTE